MARSGADAWLRRRDRLSAVLFGAHVSTAGGIHKAVGRGDELGCARCRSSPRARASGSRPCTPTRTSRASRAGRRGRLARSATRPYLDQPRRDGRPPVERSEAVLAQALRGRARPRRDRRRSCTSARISGAGFEAGLERAAPVLERVLELAGDGSGCCSRTPPGAGGTMGRTIDRAGGGDRALRAHPLARRLPRHRAPLRLGHRRRRRGRGGRAGGRGRRDDRPRPAERAAHQRLARPSWARTATATPTSARADRRAHVGLPRPPRAAGAARRARDAGPRRQGRRRAVHAGARAALAAGWPAADVHVASSIRRPTRRPTTTSSAARSPPRARGRAADRALHARQAPGPDGYGRRELFGPPLAGLLAHRPASPLRMPLKAAGHAVGLIAARPPRARLETRRRALAVGAAPVARPRARCALRGAGAGDRLHGARRPAPPLARRGGLWARALRQLRPRDRARRSQPRPPAGRGRRGRAGAHRGDPARAPARRRAAGARAASRASRASSSSGCIRPDKGLDVLIEALPAWCSGCRTRRSTVVGSPRMPIEPLRERGAALGVAGRITWDLRFVAEVGGGERSSRGASDRAAVPLDRGLGRARDGARAACRRS